MASMKLGSKPDAFQRRGQAWFCTSGLPSDMVIEVGQMTFHLHKFPLVSRCGRLAKQVEEMSEEDQEGCEIQLVDMPGGAEAFELAAKFCYRVKLALTSANVVTLRCAAEYLEMSEEFGEGNLIGKTEAFLQQVVLCSWRDSVFALKSCMSSLPQVEKLDLVEKLVHSICVKASMDPSLLAWSIPGAHDHSSLQSPGGSVLWNGISTGAHAAHATQTDWWYDDLSTLSLPLFERVITGLETRGIRPDSIAGALVHYSKKSLPGLHRRHIDRDAHITTRGVVVPVTVPPMEEDDQRIVLETIEAHLPLVKGVVSTGFLFRLLRTAMILNASPRCKSNLEKRIGMQLEQAMLDELLMPNYSYIEETLYDIDVVQRILDHFLLLDQNSPPGSDDEEEGLLLGSPSLSPIMMVAKLLDDYLAEVAPDVNLKPTKFQVLAEALPDYSRILDDGLYRAIDIFLKAHPWLSEAEREKICKIMDCQKLSLEACTHAAQNERLPLRVVVQVLLFEQLQLRTAIAGSFLVSDSLDPHSGCQVRSSMTLGEGRAATQAGICGGADGWGNVAHENQVLKGNMDRMLSRVSQLEHECNTMRHEIEKLHRGKRRLNPLSKALGCNLRSSVSPVTGGPFPANQNHNGGVGLTKVQLHQRHTSLHV